MKARRALPVLNVKGAREVRCETGDAKLTVGGDLKATFCIHAVGPDYGVMVANGATLNQCDAMLASAYHRSMVLAKDHGVRTIAFCLLSAGIYRGSRTLQAVIDIAVRSVAEADYPGLKEVHLVAFSEKESLCLHSALQKVRVVHSFCVRVSTSACSCLSQLMPAFPLQHRVQTRSINKPSPLWVLSILLEGPTTQPLPLPKLRSRQLGSCRTVRF